MLCGGRRLQPCDTVCGMSEDWSRFASVDSQAESTALCTASYHILNSGAPAHGLKCTAADLDEVQQVPNEGQPAVRPRRQQLHAEPLDDALQRRRRRVVAGRLQDFGLQGMKDCGGFISQPQTLAYGNLLGQVTNLVSDADAERLPLN